MLRWLPHDPLRHCLSYTDCKVVFLDSERAEILAPTLPVVRAGVSAGTAVTTTDFNSAPWPSHPPQFIVIDTPTSNWPSIVSLSSALQSCSTHLLDVDALRCQIPILPEDNATIVFTSGTTGLPKGVLSTQRQFLTNVLNVGSHFWFKHSLHSTKG